MTTPLIELSPQNEDYYMGRAKTYGAMGLIEKTIADFEQVKRIQPDTAPMMDRIIRGLKMRKK